MLSPFFKPRHQVDIGIWPRLTTSHRPEQTQAQHAGGAQLRLMLAQRPYDRFPVHAWIIAANSMT